MKSGVQVLSGSLDLQYGSAIIYGAHSKDRSGQMGRTDTHEVTQPRGPVPISAYFLVMENVKLDLVRETFS